MAKGYEITKAQRDQIHRLLMEQLYGREYSYSKMAEACGLSAQAVAQYVKLYAGRAAYYFKKTGVELDE